LGWPPKFLEADSNELVARALFVARYDLHSLHVGLGQLTSLQGADRDRFLGLIDRHEIVLVVGPGIGFFTQEEAASLRQVEAVLPIIDSLKDDFRISLIHLGGGPVHRFMAEPPLEAQLDRLETCIRPLALGVHQMGLRSAIENHGDYYVSDLVGLCGRVPHLGLFLDTGNCYLCGERPLVAAREAAPLVFGGHFKDQKVRPRPDGRPLHFEVGNAGLGGGHVPLREIYAEILAHAPSDRPVELQIEAFPQPWDDPIPEWERTVAFIRSL
jgi:sugar phosphate isomerase/epimerase